MRVFTLGTSDRKSFDFTKILSKYGIEVLFDVRPSTSSVQLPQFNRDNLQTLCQSQGVDYIYFGNELGGYRPDRFREYVSSEEFKRGVTIIKGKAQNRVTAILGSALLPDRCHRRIIADELAKQKVDVTHIIDESRIWPPKK